jgi:hypothetical protein
MKRIRETGDEPLCWALLVKAPPDALKKAAERHTNKGRVFRNESPWEVIAGRGAYSALVEREPGSEGTEEPLAESLWRAYPGTMYALYFDEDWEFRVLVYERGKCVDSRAEPPHELAEELQVPLPKPATRIEEVFSAARIEGASTAEVKEVLKDLLKNLPLHVEPIEGGVLVLGDEGYIGLAGSDVAEALPAATVYEVLRSGDPNVISVGVLRGDIETGTFQLPPKKVRDIPTLADVKGARTPGTIADVLGIPRAYIGLA